MRLSLMVLIALTAFIVLPAIAGYWLFGPIGAVACPVVYVVLGDWLLALNDGFVKPEPLDDFFDEVPH